MVSRSSSASSSVIDLCGHRAVRVGGAGLLLTLGDLKAILFDASLFSLFVDLGQLCIVDVLLIIVITTLSVGGVKLLYVLAAGKLAARVRCARMGRIGQRGAGVLLLGSAGT